MPLPIRHRDLLRAATGADADVLVHDKLIPFCGSFVDQGLARWELPRREEGFWAAFCNLYRRPGGPPERWRRALRRGIAPPGRRENHCPEVDPGIARRSRRRGVGVVRLPGGDAAGPARLGRHPTANGAARRPSGTARAEGHARGIPGSCACLWNDSRWRRRRGRPCNLPGRCAICVQHFAIAYSRRNLPPSSRALSCSSNSAKCSAGRRNACIALGNPIG